MVTITKPYRKPAYQELPNCSQAFLEDGQSLQLSPLLGTRTPLPNVQMSSGLLRVQTPILMGHPHSPKEKSPCHSSPGFWSPSPAKSLASSWLEPHTQFLEVFANIAIFWVPLLPCDPSISSASSQIKVRVLSPFPRLWYSPVVKLCMPASSSTPTSGPSQEVFSCAIPGLRWVRLTLALLCVSQSG